MNHEIKKSRSHQSIQSIRQMHISGRRVICVESGKLNPLTSNTILLQTSDPIPVLSFYLFLARPTALKLRLRNADFL